MGMLLCGRSAIIAAVVIGLTNIMAYGAEAAAAPNCKKGIPCGNSCIAANKTCRIGTSETPAKESSPQPSTAASGLVQLSGDGAKTVPAKLPSGESPKTATAKAPDSDWIGSASDRVYYRAECSAARDLAPSNRVVFPSESAAIAAGFRHSSVPGC